MTNRLSNDKVKLALSDLRSKIRNGVLVISYRDNGPTALRSAAMVKLGFGTGYVPSSYNFNPQTVRRFAKLFDVPTYDGTRYPSQDDTATALQNFINRRSDPWSHVRAVPTNEQVLATEVSPVNV